MVDNYPPAPNPDINRLADWLLASTVPSISYLTLTGLLDRPQTDPEVVAARNAIMSEGPLPAILAQQTPAGSWTGESSYYTPKYTSTHWSLLLYTELAGDPADVRFQQGVTFMLEDTAATMANELATWRQGLSCFWGNLLRYATYAGRVDDPRVEAIVDFLVSELSKPAGVCACPHNDGWACAWGAVRALWGLVAAGATADPPVAAQARDTALAFLLDAYDLATADYPTPESGKIHTMWSRLNFPLFYQVDILFTLRVLAQLDALDHPTAQRALDWLAGRRMKNGRWRGNSPYRGRTWPDVAPGREVDRWVSLQSALILRQAGRM